MTASRPTWLEVSLLHQLLGNNEPLVGDLVEECPHRSRSWFWRQILFAVLARAITSALATLREPRRLAAGLTSLGMFIVLGFQVVVAGSLLDDLIPRLDRGQMTRSNHAESLVFLVMLSVPVAWFIGKVMSRLHRRLRVASVVVCGASAAAVASMIVSVLSSEGSGVFFPSLPLQTASALVFVLALLVGGLSSSLHDRQPAS